MAATTPAPGASATAIAALDAQARAERAIARDQLQALIARDRQADAVGAALDQAVEALAHAALVAAGFHQHARGEWRRRRGSKPTPSERQS